MDYNARNDEIWKAQRDARATVRLLNARFSAKKSAWFWHKLQNLIVWACVSVRSMIVILVVAAVPVCAQAQSPSAAKPSKGDAEKVVTIISGDKAKTQAYCDMQKLALQVEEASAKNDGKTVEELSQKIETLEKTLGPEYLALLDGFQDIASDDELGAEFMSAAAALDRLCTN